ncbi:hypothetical protein [Clostridium saccharoperbutylacetonicum]|uniref:hypothetical protein n=1 Tax=Clostridium saccharoperbutylacetonicum TaxID=36745 RepID=UPI0009843124|nr:hypothetical protein [Clostridium saccharoperbutylacetonicum]NSB29105.1 hypothetical protein [Clostridium saccharoperbutylacetonicum]
MKTVLLTNKEAQYYIEELDKMIENSELENKYEILPESIELNFIEPNLIIGGVEALYAGIKIIEFGYQKVKKMIESKNVKEFEDKHIKSIEKLNNDKKDEYIVNVDGENIEISLQNSVSAIKVNIKNFKS